LLEMPFLFLTIYIIRTEVINRKRLLLSLLFTTVVSVCFFIMFPTIMIRETLVNTNIFDNIVGFIYSSDLGFNAFPSLHVSLITCALYFLSSKKKYWYVFVLGLLIIVSTLFVKQHSIIDVFGGLTIAIISIFISEKIFKNNGVKL